MNKTKIIGLNPAKKTLRVGKWNNNWSQLIINMTDMSQMITLKSDRLIWAAISCYLYRRPIKNLSTLLWGVFLST